MNHLRPGTELRCAGLGAEHCPGRVRKTAPMCGTVKLFSSVIVSGAEARSPGTARTSVIVACCV
jgi:hypothetical protein